MDVIQLLAADHDRIARLFDDFDRWSGRDGDEQKVALARQICTELAVHGQIEEELFYPAARAVMGGEHDLLDEAVVEHAMVKELIAAIAAMSADEPLFDAKVKVLAEYVRHHVREEEQRLFPRLRATALDLGALGERLAQRQEQLLDEFADVLGGAAARHPVPGAARSASAAH